MDALSHADGRAPNGTSALPVSEAPPQVGAYPGRVARVVILVGLIITVMAVAAGLWPQSVRISGQRRSCPVALFYGLPSDPSGRPAAAALDAACTDKTHSLVGLTFLSLIVGPCLLVGGTVVELARRSRGDPPPPPTEVTWYQA